MELKEKIHELIKTAKPVRQVSVLQVMDHFKDFTKEEIRAALDNLLKEGETYEMPETICLIE